jgi:histidinol-phosphate/aromatic aminotransferase/cobyric acid decarboxylase-like protein
MNRITRLAAITLSLAAAGSAFADDITIDTDVHNSIATRAQVQQELAQFKRGANPWSSSYNNMTALHTTRSRADVANDVKAARANGTLTAMTGEDSGSNYLAQLQYRAQDDSAVKLAQRTTR